MNGRDSTAAVSAASSATSWRWTPLCIFVGCVLVYHANGGKSHVGADTLAAPYSAWALVRTGTLDCSGYGDSLGVHLSESMFKDSPGGGRVSIRPIGSTLVMLPLVAPIAIFRQEPFNFDIMGQLGKLAGACCVAGATVLFWLLCRARVPGAAWPATILFAFGNCLWSVASQSIWMHGPATLWLTWTMYLLLRSPGGVSFRSGVLSGLFLGMAVLTRPSTGLFVVFTMLGLIGARRWRALLGTMLGGVAPVIVLLVSNRMTHGDWVFGGYASDDWTMPTPLWIGVSGLLFAPSRGLFVYSPALVFLPLGLVALFRRGRTSAPSSASGAAIEGGDRLMILCWCAAGAGTIAFFGKWHDWYGGWCFGPRFLIETMPIFCLLFAMAYDQLTTNLVRRIAVGLIGLSVLVSAVGVFGRSGESEWYLREERADQGLWLFSMRDTQIEAYMRICIGKIVHRGPTAVRADANLDPHPGHDRSR